MRTIVVGVGVDGNVVAVVVEWDLTDGTNILNYLEIGQLDINVLNRISPKKCQLACYPFSLFFEE